MLKGTFQQSEFAADITAVHTGKAPTEYQDAVAFFERTFITEGMRLLLTQVAQRLNGKGGEPVIQLQTAFGGGKTHTMLAVLSPGHAEVPALGLAGHPGADRSGRADGRAAGPRRGARRHGPRPGPAVEAWQADDQDALGRTGLAARRRRGFALVKEADANGTSPGKDVLRQLLEAYAPCVVLMDELVAYIRQFPEGQALSGGTYDSNLSFVQALTEAAKLVPTAIVLARLPESRRRRPGSPAWRGGAAGAGEDSSAACRRSGSRWPPKRRSRSCGGGCSSRSRT